MKSKIIQTYCVVDKKPIPPERAARKSNTCDDLCGRKLKAHRRAVQDAKKCRHCSRPSTPLERLEYQRWRRSQPGYAPKQRGRPKNPATKEAEILRDLLILASCHVPLPVVMAWDKPAKQLAEKWAVKTHLHASDNPVRVPPMPEFLRAYYNLVV